MNLNKLSSSAVSTPIIPPTHHVTSVDPAPATAEMPILAPKDAQAQLPLTSKYQQAQEPFAFLEEDMTQARKVVQEDVKAIFQRQDPQQAIRFVQLHLEKSKNYLAKVNVFKQTLAESTPSSVTSQALRSEAQSGIKEYSLAAQQEALYAELALEELMPILAPALTHELGQAEAIVKSDLKTFNENLKPEQALNLVLAHLEKSHQYRQIPLSHESYQEFAQAAQDEAIYAELALSHLRHKLDSPARSKAE